MKQTAFDVLGGQDLTGKVFVITGGYAGLGAVSTKALLMANATVIIGGRNKETQIKFTNGLQDHAVQAPGPWDRFDLWRWPFCKPAAIDPAGAPDPVPSPCTR